TAIERYSLTRSLCATSCAGIRSVAGASSRLSWQQRQRYFLFRVFTMKQFLLGLLLFTTIPLLVKEVWLRVSAAGVLGLALPPQQFEAATKVVDLGDKS